MAGIQQTFNQALQSAQIGVALYSQTPAGKNKTQLTSINKRADLIGERLEQSETPVSATSDEKTDAIYTADFKEQVDLAKQKYELDPSKANYKEYRELSETFEEWENTLKASYDKRIKTKQDQKKALDMRMKLLEADPNPLNIKKTKVEV